MDESGSHRFYTREEFGNSLVPPKYPMPEEVEVPDTTEPDAVRAGTGSRARKALRPDPVDLLSPPIRTLPSLETLEGFDSRAEEDEYLAGVKPLVAAIHVLGGKRSKNPRLSIVESIVIEPRMSWETKYDACRVLLYQVCADFGKIRGDRGQRHFRPVMTSMEWLESFYDVLQGFKFVFMRQMPEEDWNYFMRLKSIA